MKNLTVRIEEGTYAELKICAKHLNTTPAKILETFVKDLLEETNEANVAQKWFWHSKHKFS